MKSDPSEPIESPSQARRPDTCEMAHQESASGGSEANHWESALLDMPWISLMAMTLLWMDETKLVVSIEGKVFSPHFCRKKFYPTEASHASCIDPCASAMACRNFWAVTSFLVSC